MSASALGLPLGHLLVAALMQALGLGEVLLTLGGTVAASGAETAEVLPVLGGAVAASGVAASRKRCKAALGCRAGSLVPLAVALQ